jgi:MFS transporter, DHA1 family, multidrug resistance protein
MTLTATPSTKPVRSQREFVAIATVCTTLAALAIDTTLPAFNKIRAHYDLAADSTRVSWIVNAFLLGMAVGALLFGTLSDRFGRKRLLIGGLALYVLAGSVAATAPSLVVLFAARFVWGFAASAPRAIIMAMVRDRFEGEAMARIVSLMMAAFMFVPILAPSVGKALMALGPWQLVFWVPTIGGALVLIWVMVRLPETLAVADRRSVGPAALLEAAKVIASSRATVGFTIALTFGFGVLSSFLSGLEIIIDKVFGQGRNFPFVFGGVSILMMVVTYANSHAVTRRGLAVMLRVCAGATLVAAAALAMFVVVSGRHPAFLVFCILLAFVMAAQQAVVPNANSAAMEPVGHIAGAAASVIAFTSTAGGALIGQLVSGAYNGTARPFAISVLVLAVLTAVSIAVTLRRTTGTTPPAMSVATS